MKITLAVLAEKLDNLIANNKKEHSDILGQVQKTNGHVDDNASEISKLKDWKNRLVGALVVMNAIILPIAFIIIRQWLTN